MGEKDTLASANGVPSVGIRMADGEWSGWGATGNESGQVQLGEHFVYESPFLWYTFVISIVAVTVRFLISLLFPDNCSGLSLSSLPYVPPAFLFGHILGCQSGMGRRGALNWE